jgi:putative ABC transport system ATP-binding protein
MKLSSVIKLNQVSKVYQRDNQVYSALQNINIDIKDGEFVSIMGQSGAGKSTLMNIIGLLDNPSSGDYFLSGQEVSQLNDDQRSIIRNQKLGFVFQSFFLLPRLNILQNVLLPTLYHGHKEKDFSGRALHLLNRIGLAGMTDRKPQQLSGGQQQRVAIARALMCQPTVILADEPTGALDSETGQMILNLFKDLNNAEKVTIIIVTHDHNIANQCQRIISIKDGQVV